MTLLHHVCEYYIRFVLENYRYTQSLKGVVIYNLLLYMNNKWEDGQQIERSRDDLRA